MPGSQQTHRNRVLLVDSDHRTSNRLASLLRDDGFDVDVVSDGTAALARLSRGPLPEALVTELNVPFVDGASVARYARGQRPEVQIVIVTGHPHSVRGGALGDGPPPLVLTKPLDYGELLSALQAAPEAADEVEPLPRTDGAPSSHF
jgi:DNA-binding response OmpR family regulator